MSLKRPLPIFSLATLAAFIALVLLPVAWALAHSVTDAGDGLTLAAYRAAYDPARQWSLLINSLKVGAGVSALATVLGVCAGYSISRLQPLGKSALLFLFALPFLIPPHISALAWIDILGRNGVVASLLSGAPLIEPGAVTIYGAGGTILVMGLSYFPVVALFTAPALSRMDARMEEAASLCAPGWRTLVWIAAPVALPWVLTGSLVVFLLALSSFSVPSILQVNTWPVEIFSRFNSGGDIREGTALALPLIGCGLLAALLWSAFLKPRQPWLTGGSRANRDERPGGLGRIAGSAWCWLLATVSAILPVSAIAARAFSLNSFFTAVRTAGGEIATSLLLAAVSATVLCALSLAMAYAARRGSFGRVYNLDVVSFVFSGPALGLGLILIWNRAGPASWVYDGVAIMVLACVARYIVFPHRTLEAALGDLHPSLEEAAEIHGAGAGRTFFGITMPLLAPALAVAWTLSFLLCLAEADTVVMVAPPGWTTLSARIFSLTHYGPSQVTAALSLVSVGMVAGQGRDIDRRYSGERQRSAQAASRAGAGDGVSGPGPVAASAGAVSSGFRAQGAWRAAKRA